MLDLANKLRPWALLRALRVGAAKLRRPARTTPVARAKIGAPYDDIDDEFHASYEQARLHIEHDVPVFVVLAHELVFLHGQERTSWSISPPAYHLIKAVSHAPLAVFSARQPSERAVRGEDAAGRRVITRQWLEAALHSLPQRAAELTPEVHDDLRAVLSQTLHFLAQPSERQGRADVSAFARSLGPTLLRLIDAATQLQLEALHTRVEEALSRLSADEQSRLEVVVTGNHQARVRSLPMQYFKLRLGEPSSAEKRVAYAESVDNEGDALSLVATRRLDRAVSLAFFADPTRMQRDLLGDAAAAQLERAELAPIADARGPGRGASE